MCERAERSFQACQLAADDVQVANGFHLGIDKTACFHFQDFGLERLRDFDSDIDDCGAERCQACQSTQWEGAGLTDIKKGFHQH